MRRGRDNGWLLDENGGLMGVNLGADFTAEHEWGITDLKKTLGAPGAENEHKYNTVVEYGGLYGIERRRCKPKDEKCVALKEDNGTLNLIVARDYTLQQLLENPLDRTDAHRCEWRFWKEDTLVTAWCEDSFIIRVHLKNEEDAKRLRLLHEELLKGNVAVWLGGGGVFQNAGLCLAIINNIPEENKKTMREGDMDRERLLKAAEATGIKKKIEEANTNWRKMQEVETGSRCYKNKWGFYALSPRWVSSQEKKNTKHPVVFWLNPEDQDVNQYGLFTVEDLEQWLQGKGKIIK